jgi:Uma2 family endonuclease
MYPVDAASVWHSEIQLNFVTGLRQRFKSTGRSCKAVGPNVRVELPNKRYACPDIVVVCGKLEFDGNKRDTILNPIALIEILSPSTGDFDRGGKADLCREIPSLRDYIVVAQDRPRLDWYSRQGERRWTLEGLWGLEAVLKLESIGVEISLSEIFDGLEFDQES